MSSWVRLWHDMPTDPKWRVIARASEQSIGNVIAVFNFLMVEASKNPEERGQANINTEDVAAALDISETDVQRIIEAMQGRVMENGKLKGWEKRQPLREDGSAERSKEWRERNRTQPNAGKRPDADADADADAEQKTLSQAVSEYNALAVKVGLAECQKLTATRKARLKARLADGGGLDGWRTALRKIDGNKFLCGGGPSGWKAHFDFLLQESSFTKLMEGGYDGNANAPPARKKTAFEENLEAARELIGGRG